MFKGELISQNLTQKFYSPTFATQKFPNLRYTTAEIRLCGWTCKRWKQDMNKTYIQEGDSTIEQFLVEQSVFLHVFILTLLSLCFQGMNQEVRSIPYVKYGNPVSFKW